MTDKKFNITTSLKRRESKRPGTFTPKQPGEDKFEREQAPRKSRRNFLKSSPTQETKYQAIRLYNSNQISLSDLKALFRVTSVVATNEYSNKGDIQDVLKSRDNVGILKRLTKTRDAARQEAILRLNKKSPLVTTRAEHIAAFTTGYDAPLPHNWKRYPQHERKGPPNSSRPGSSDGKIGKTVYKGFKDYNRDFERLRKALIKLVKSGNRKAAAKALKGLSAPTITVKR
jgi:hypothetical protein